MPTGQGGSQLPAKQSGIGAGYDQVVLAAMEFVDEALPMRVVLNLIEKEVLALAINGFDRLEQFIATYLAAQRVVFKIQVGKTTAGKRLKGSVDLPARRGPMMTFTKLEERAFLIESASWRGTTLRCSAISRSRRWASTVVFSNCIVLNNNRLYCLIQDGLFFLTH